MTNPNKMSELEEHMANLIDEIGIQERHSAELETQLRSARESESSWMASCESLLAYTAHLEQKVFIPALGDLASALNEFKEAEGFRGRAKVLLSSHKGTPRMQPLLDMLNRPTHSGVHDLIRSQQLEHPPVPDLLDDSYVLLVALLESKTELTAVLRDAQQRASLTTQSSSSDPRVTALERELAQLKEQLAAAKQYPSLSSASSFTAAADKEDLLSHIDRLRTANAALTKEVAMLSEHRALNHGLNKEDERLVAARVETLTKQLQASEMENEQLRRKAGTSYNLEGLYNNSEKQQRLLQDRVRQLEDEARAFDEERRQVKLHFQRIENELRKSRGGAADSMVAFAAAPTASSPGSPALSRQLRELEEENHLLKEQLSTTQREAAMRQARLEKQVADLKRKVAILTQQPNGFAGGDADGIFLRDSLGATRSGSAMTDESQGLNRDPEVSPRHASGVQETKLRVFEMTVKALNAELGQLEDKIIQLETNHAEERRTAENQIDEERRRMQEEKQEMDQVFARVTDELDQQMRENEELRRRLAAARSN